MKRGGGQAGQGSDAPAGPDAARDGGAAAVRVHGAGSHPRDAAVQAARQSPDARRGAQAAVGGAAAPLRRAGAAPPP